MRDAERLVTDPAWDIVLAASALTEELERKGCTAAFGLDEQGRLRPLAADGPDAVIVWSQESSWQSRVPVEDPRSPLLDLYLPVCGGTSARPVTVGHLGQSLDGFIATHSGDSQFVTGNDKTDANVPNSVAFQQNWVQHLIGRWGNSQTNGLRYYILDNEHSIWFSTHRDVAPTGATMDETFAKMRDYAAMIKNRDPNALVVGPEEWGWSGYLYSGYDQWFAPNNNWT